jgi:hypothetical protein
MTDKKNVGFPHLSYEEAPIDTRPLGLHEIPLQARIEREMAVVRLHHERIAKSIDIFWGHRDCDEYLQKLIFSGGDGSGKTRIGFKAEVLQALISLSELHIVSYR